MDDTSPIGAVLCVTHGFSRGWTMSSTHRPHRGRAVSGIYVLVVIIDYYMTAGVSLCLRSHAQQIGGVARSAEGVSQSLPGSEIPTLSVFTAER